MALLFNADTETVDIGSGSSIDDLDPFTLIQVIEYTAVDGTIHTSWEKTANFQVREGSFGTGELQFYHAYSGTDLNVVSSNTPITQDTWMYSACVGNGTSAAPRMYCSDLDAVLTEVTYNTQTTPTGTITSEAATTAELGHSPSNNSRSHVGNFQRQIVMNQACTLAECDVLVRKPWFGASNGLVVWIELGWNGTGTQNDYSGNGNNGTVTGATQADGPPMWPAFAPGVM